MHSGLTKFPLATYSIWLTSNQLINHIANSGTIFNALWINRSCSLSVWLTPNCNGSHLLIEHCSGVSRVMRDKSKFLQKCNQEYTSLLCRKRKTIWQQSTKYATYFTFVCWLTTNKGFTWLKTSSLTEIPSRYCFSNDRSWAFSCAILAFSLSNAHLSNNTLL